MKTPEEIFNEIPFLSICEEGKWYQLPKKEVIEAIKQYATQCQQDNAETDRERKLIHQLFIGKVVDEIGQAKTMQLLKESHEAITTLNKQ